MQPGILQSIEDVLGRSIAQPSTDNRESCLAVVRIIPELHRVAIYNRDQRLTEFSMPSYSARV